VALFDMALVTARELVRYTPVLLRQTFSPQTLDRRPETAEVMSDEASVKEYNEAMGLKLAIVYALALEVIYRAMPEKTLTQLGAQGRAVDLAPGPGHFTLMVARNFSFAKVMGVDLSRTMINAAQANAAALGLSDRVAFNYGDATDLSLIETGSVQLACTTNAIHHFPSLDSVAGTFAEMDRIAAPDGLIFAMDLVRLKTDDLTKNYTAVVGRDYHKQGYSVFQEDFIQSMYAAWTVPEIRQALPQNSRRTWIHWTPFGVPMTQIVLGLPVGQAQHALRGGLPWKPHAHPVPAAMRGEWALSRALLYAGSRFKQRPRT